LSYGSFQGNATGDLVEFLGMPYAAPPLRFAAPTLPLRFAGVRQATSFGAACPQQATAIPGGSVNFSTSLSSEDCLFINVVKPASIPTGKKLPVLFWIYGGSFQDGDSSMNPALLGFWEGRRRRLQILEILVSEISVSHWNGFTNTLLPSAVTLTKLQFGARVQAPYPLVYNSLSIMGILMVCSTERSWNPDPPTI